LDPFPSLKRYSGLIYEVLITTDNFTESKKEDLPFNVAPMGINFTSKKCFLIEPYKTSKTYKNLVKINKFGINFSSDASLFYKCIYEKEIFVKEDFSITNSDKIPFLNTSIYDSIQLVMGAKKNREISSSGERARFECELDSEIFFKKEFEPCCRANNLALEAIVHSTRIEVLKDPKEREKLLELINTYHEFIEKTAGNSIYHEILDKLKIKLKSIN